MKPTIYRGTLTAISEIHHGGDEQTGNVRLLRTVKMWSPADSRIVRLPVITGNAIRGVLRRKLMKDMLERIDYGPTSPKLHHALYTGGTLESTGDISGALDLPARRKLSETIPAIALLGTAVLNDMVPGQLIVDFARPFCRETAPYLAKAGYDDPRMLTNARAFRDFTFTTRRDDLRDGDSHQMIVTFEYFAAGTAFAHAFRLRHPTPILESTLGAMLELWKDDPVIGGKAAGGFGLLDLDYGDVPDPTLYYDYLEANGDLIRGVLDDLARRLEGKPKAGVLSADIPF
jgi:hypothetical protein